MDSLIQVPESSNDTGLSTYYAELRKTQEEKFQDAIGNLVCAKTPKEVVYKRPIRGGSQADYIPGWWFIEQLNALFNYNWDLKILDKGFLGSPPTYVWVEVELIVRSGLIVVSKTAFGGSDVKKLQSTGAIMDLGDDLKSAATDGMKKAATLLGIAADIYGKKEVQSTAAPNKSQLDTLYKVGEKANMDQAKVDAFIEKKYPGKKSKDLEIALILSLIGELRSIKV